MVGYLQVIWPTLHPDPSQLKYPYQTLRIQRPLSERETLCLPTRKKIMSVIEASPPPCFRAEKQNKKPSAPREMKHIVDCTED
jgi:hypothetical protein